MEVFKMEGFGFEIGETVYYRLTIKTPLLIVARLLKECSGGVQKQYECRLGISCGYPPVTLEPTKTFLFHEIELER